MQILLSLIITLFTVTGYPSPTDLWASDVNSLDDDIFTANEPLIPGANDGSQYSVDDVWPHGGSDLLAYDSENSNSQLLDVVPPPSADDWLSSTSLDSPGSSTSPGADVLVAGGETCSLDSMMNVPMRRRDFSLGSLWDTINMFRKPQNDKGPAVCPAADSKPITGAEDPAQEDPRFFPWSDCRVGYMPFCCRGDLTPLTTDHEQCWLYSIGLKPLCRYMRHLWCCLDFDSDSGDASGCYQLYPDAL